MQSSWPWLQTSKSTTLPIPHLFTCKLLQFGTEVISTYHDLHDYFMGFKAIYRAEPFSFSDLFNISWKTWKPVWTRAPQSSIRVYSVKHIFRVDKTDRKLQLEKKDEALLESSVGEQLSLLRCQASVHHCCKATSNTSLLLQAQATSAHRDYFLRMRRLTRSPQISATWQPPTAAFSPVCVVSAAVLTMATETILELSHALRMRRRE